VLNLRRTGTPRMRRSRHRNWMPGEPHRCRSSGRTRSLDPAIARKAGLLHSSSHTKFQMCHSSNFAHDKSHSNWSRDHNGPPRNYASANPKATASCRIMEEVSHGVNITISLCRYPTVTLKLEITIWRFLPIARSCNLITIACLQESWALHAPR
jgi:hypothetical protein